MSARSRAVAVAGAAGAAVLVLGSLLALASGPSLPHPGLGLPGVDLGPQAGAQGRCAPGARFDPPTAAARTLGGQQVAKAAFAAGFRGGDLVVAVAVARAESGWNPRATNANTNGSTDLGLFQINTVHGALLRQGDPLAPTDNARMAFRVWSEAGGSWRPWVTFWRGTYRQHLGEAALAVEGVGAALGTETGCTAAVVTASGLSDPGTGPQGANGYTPRAENVRAVTMARWGCGKKAAPCIRSIGGYAPRNIAGTSTPSDHATGNAADIMLGATFRTEATNALGWEIARFWVANAEAAGVKYVIFDHQIWSSERAAEGWRGYQHPGGFGGPVFGHENHPHVSVKS